MFGQRLPPHHSHLKRYIGEVVLVCRRRYVLRRTAVSLNQLPLLEVWVNRGNLALNRTQDNRVDHVRVCRTRTLNLLNLSSETYYKHLQLKENVYWRIITDYYLTK